MSNSCGRPGSVVLPTDPSNDAGLTASGISGGILVRVRMPAVRPEAVAYTILYSSPSNSFLTAVERTKLRGEEFYDWFDHPTQRFYWIEQVSINGTREARIGPVSATSIDPSLQLIEHLSGKISQGLLATSLRESIQRIDPLHSKIDDEVINRAKELGTLTQVINDIAEESNGNLANFNERLTVLATNQESIVENVETILTNFVGEGGPVTSAIQEAAFVQSSATQALAEKTTQLEGIFADENGNIQFGALQQQLSKTKVDKINNTIENAWMVKLQSQVPGQKPLIGGFGIVNDGREVEAGFDVDRFWVGRRNKAGIYPFIIDTETNSILFNGQVNFTNITGDDKPEAGATRNESRGAWANNRAYIRGDVVTADGNSWVARNTHTSTSGNRPPVLSTTTSTTWALLASKGDQGVTGLTVTTVQVYKRSSTVLGDAHKPTTNSSIVYNFSTGTVSGISNGWSSTIPAGTDPLYVTVASVDAPFTTTTVTIPPERFSTPVKYVENGLNTATVFLFRRTTDSTVPAKPERTGGVTYSFTTHSLADVPSGWAEDLPATGGRYRWVSKATAVSTSETDVINNSEWSTPRLIAEDGIDGAPGSSGAAGADARTVDLIPDTSAIAYNSDGGRITSSVSFTAYPKGLTGTAFYRFYVNDVAQGSGATTTATFSYTPSTTYNVTPISVEVEVREGSSSGIIVARDEVTLYPVKAGSDALTVILSNEAHTVPADSSGNVTSYAGSGTVISTYQGSTELQYESGTGFPSTSGRFRVVPSSTSITVGTRTTSGLKALVANASSMTADTASISFVVNIRNTNGTTSTITKVQTFSKSRRGVDGANGTNGTNGANGRSTAIIYRLGTNVTKPPNGVTFPPTNWTLTLPVSSTTPVYSCTGRADSTGSWTWETPIPDVSNLGLTVISGGNIYADKLAVNGARIQGTLDYNRIRTNGNVLTELIPYNIITGNSQLTSKASINSINVSNGDAAQYFNNNNVNGLEQTRLQAITTGYGETGSITISGTLSIFARFSRVIIRNNQGYTQWQVRLAAGVYNANGQFLHGRASGGVIFSEYYRLDLTTDSNSKTQIVGTNMPAYDVGSDFVDVRASGIVQKDVPFSITFECKNSPYVSVIITCDVYFHGQFFRISGGNNRVQFTNGDSSSPGVIEARIRNLSIKGSRV